MARSMVGHAHVQLATTRTRETCGAYCCASGPPCAINHSNSGRSASVSGLSSGRVPTNGSDSLLSAIGRSIGQSRETLPARSLKGHLLFQLLTDGNQEREPGKDGTFPVCFMF